MKRGRPKGSTGIKSEKKRVRELQRGLGRALEKYLAFLSKPKTQNHGRVTINLLTGKIVKVGRPKKRKARRRAKPKLKVVKTAA